VAFSFNDFAIINFASFIAMILIIARKTITAVFDTMALQIIEVLVWPIQWNKQTRFFTVAMFSLISLCVTAAL